MTLEEKIKNFEKELCDDCKNDKVHLTAECGLETKMINPQWTIKLMQECVEEERMRILEGLKTVTYLGEYDGKRACVENNTLHVSGVCLAPFCLPNDVKSLINKSN